MSDEYDRNSNGLNREHANPPNQRSLSYRLGTRASLLEALRSALAHNAAAPRDLALRDGGDSAIALLDAWATLADVLTFYQERIANEGFLGTAREPRSILELVRLVGYRVRPGVAASTHLAFTIEESVQDEITIHAKTRAQSLPRPGELPQPYETLVDVTARKAWNKLLPRQDRGQTIDLNNPDPQPLLLNGASAGLSSDTPLLIDVGEAQPRLFRITAVEIEPKVNRKKVMVVPWGQATPAPKVEAPDTAAPQIAAVAPARRQPGAEEGSATAAPTIAEVRPQSAESSIIKLLTGTAYREAITALAPTAPADAGTAEPNRPDSPNAAADATDAARTTSKAPADVGAAEPNRPDSPNAVVDAADPERKEAIRRLQTALDPKLEQLGVALRNAAVDTQLATAQPSADVRQICAVYVLRLQARPFGARAPRLFWPTPIFHPSTEWKLQGEKSNVLVLDNAYEAILPGGYVVIVAPAWDKQMARKPSEQAALHPDRVLVRKAKSVTHGMRDAYKIKARATRIEIDRPWWKTGDSVESLPDDALPGEFATVRAATVYTQSEPLQLADMPDLSSLGPVAKNDQVTTIVLDQLYEGLPNGRELILSGERAGLAGYVDSEVLELTYAEQLPPDQNIPGDVYRTRLHLKDPLRHAYRRDSVVIYGNVAKATHGETRDEVLGSGDGSQALQAFRLGREKLTYVSVPAAEGAESTLESVPTAEGAESTLEVFVNGIRWQERPRLASPHDDNRAYMLVTDADQRTTVQFGNGEHGARLPTGLENVRARYRAGIGAEGNTARERITMLATRPFGVKSVTNPVPASGGADRESDAQAQRNAPLGLQTLDRLVGPQDYEDFARVYAGIAKARAVRLPGPSGDIIRVTIAAAGKQPITPDSALYTNLLSALRNNAGYPIQTVEIENYEPVALLLHARVQIEPDRRWNDVEQAMRAALRDHFSFERREFGQPVAPSEVIDVMSNVAGVRAIDIEHLAGVTRLQARDTNRLIEIWNTFEPPDQLYQGKPVNEFEKSDRPYQGKPVKVESRQLAFFLSEAEAPETIHLEQPHDRRI